MNTITMKELRRLCAMGGAMSLYPRKMQVCFDGYKYFKLTKAQVKFIKGTK